MEKIEQIEKTRSIHAELAEKYHLQRYLTPPNPDDDFYVRKCRTWFWEQLKAEVSSRLSSMDAIFVTMNEFDEEELIQAIIDDMNGISEDLQSYIEDYKSTDDEEGGIE